MCKGEGIGVNLKSVGEPCGFIVDATKAGQAELQVMTTNGKGNGQLFCNFLFFFLIK